MYWVWWLVIAAAALVLVCLAGLGLVAIFDYSLSEDASCALGCIAGVPGVLALVTCIVSIVVGGCGEYKRIQQPLYWQEFTIMCQDVIDSGNVITNRDMTKQIIEYNKWLVDARADQQTKGQWSLWHDVDLSQFNYITLGDGTEFEITFGDSNN